MKSEFAGKQAHIIGMARSGMAAADVLVSLGASVVMHDRKEASALTAEMDMCRSLGVIARTGADAYNGISEADFVVTSPGVPDTCTGLIEAINKGIEVLPEIELAYRISLAPIVAITGTNGKTTTTAMIGDMLRADGRRVFVAGNIVAGNIRLPLVRAAEQASPNDVIVAEISSFQLELVSSFKPRVAVLLNISSDHMDRHPDIETYASMKARLFEFQESGEYAVLNADDPTVMRYVQSIKSCVWQFSSTHEVEVGTFLRGSEVWLRTQDGDQLVCDTRTMKLRGIHNIENILAASAAAMAFDADTERIQSAVNEFQPLEHRLEPVAEINGVEFLNNSMCTNVDASVRSLQAIGRPAIVIAGGKDKGSDYTELGKAFVSYAKHVVLIGKDAPLIEKSARAAGYDRISNAGSMEEAVDMAWRVAEQGDTVLLSPGCASFDMFNDFEHRGRVFKEAVHLLENSVRDRDGI
ncbi:MAG: UDP-N-acetylmuramoyl-L-alanine--D-glutamate ligase [Armatimonadota bacterium]